MTLRANTTRLNLDEADAAWDALAGRLEAFSEAWDAGQTPAVAEYAPASPPGVRRMTLVELVKYDLERRWQANDHRRLETYLAELPELTVGDGPPADLLYEEFHCRKQAGEAPDAEEYFKQYPSQAGALRRLLGMERSDLTTAFYTAARVEELEVGARVDDFDLLARLGRGAFATVFLARQRSMQRMVALKISADHGREPQTLAQLDHPHIVRVYDQRVLAQKGMRLLYMQYVAGGTLQEALERIRELPEEARNGRALLSAIDRVMSNRGEAAPIGSALRERISSLDWPQTVCLLGMHLAEALAYAHRRGVLHRDLKPANVLLSSEGAAQLVDFNISFCSNLDGAAPAAYFGGSLAYMSPEQLEACDPDHPQSAAELDHRADVYSLGVLIYEMLALERPLVDRHLEEGWSATLAAMIERRRARLSDESLATLRRLAPAPLAAVVEQCVSAKPGDRPASAGEVARRLWCVLREDATRLLAPSPHWAARFALRMPLIALLLAAIVPNGVAGVFNYFYNRGHIVEQLEGAQDVFWNTQAAVNLTAFPLGMAWMYVLVRPLGRTIRGLRRGIRPSAEMAAAMRARALSLGRITALVGISLWAIAGIVYPVSIHLGGAPMVAHDFLHFTASLALGGLIAAAYPFFAITWIALRAFYPVLYRAGQTSAADPDGFEEVRRLVGLERLTWRYLGLAASLPMLGVVVMVIFGVQDSDRVLLAILSVGSLVGLGFVYLLARIEQHDLGALAEIVAHTQKQDAA
jgi:serine/threonine protein kinase